MRKNLYQSMVQRKIGSRRDGENVQKQARAAVNILLDSHIHVKESQSQRFKDINSDDEVSNYIQESWQSKVEYKIDELVAEAGIPRDRLLVSIQYRAVADMIFYEVSQDMNTEESIKKAAERLKKIHSSFFSAIKQELIEKIPEESASAQSPYFDHYDDVVDDREEDDSDYGEADVRVFLKKKVGSLNRDKVIDRAVDILQESSDLNEIVAREAMKSAYAEFTSNSDRFIEGVLDLFDERDFEEMENNEDAMIALNRNARKNKSSRRLYKLGNSKTGGTIIFGSILCIILVSIGLGGLATDLAWHFLSLAGVKVTAGTELIDELTQ